MAPTADEVTRLLKAWSAGELEVEDRLFELILPDLHALARCLMAGERPGHSLQPTALMNEAYLRLTGARAHDWQSRKHFFAVAARIMRHLLIDYARRRSKDARLPLDDLENLLRGRETQLEQGLAVSELLDEMAKTHPSWCSVIEMKFFVGFTDQETADALQLPRRTVQRQFADARRWLFERLESES
jgi:RNA polymerase sigma factor (TIGR02999 family)